MKNTFIKIIIPLIAITLTSCSVRRRGHKSSSSESIESSETSSEQSSEQSSESSSESSSGSSSGSLSSSETSSSSESSSEDPGTGYTQVTKLSMLSSDLDKRYAPALGDVKLLVVPITFAGNTASGYTQYIQPWTNTKLQQVNGFYFGETDSLASYYKTASFDKLRITGMVADIYQNTTFTVKEVLDDGSMNALWDMMDAALDWLYETTDIDWSEYDLNRDGCIDNIHFVTDYVSQEWGANLWPHMYFTDRTGTLEKPMINVYSMSGTGFVSDAITAIHEQGHIFGLDDYYDYSNGGSSPIDYIGHLDMQSHNCFDWNSYSKLTTGWVDPYVIDGTKDVTEITITAASKNGDCLIIPADYSTWNGSAFDEYILLELFAPFGNNKADWSRYSGTLGSAPGIRLYHVDGRVYGSNKTERWNPMQLIVDDMEDQEINCVEDIERWEYTTRGANNSSDWKDYEGGIYQLGSHPMLTLVQRGGDFTFAKTDYDHHTLQAGDLFKRGHSFTFSKYSHFMNKNIAVQDTMDNGEVFPYQIDVVNITSDTATLKITKIL